MVSYGNTKRSQFCFPGSSRTDSTEELQCPAQKVACEGRLQHLRPCKLTDMQRHGLCCSSAHCAGVGGHRALRLCQQAQSTRALLNSTQRIIPCKIMGYVETDRKGLELRLHRSHASYGSSISQNSLGISGKWLRSRGTEYCPLGLRAAACGQPLHPC